MNAYSPKHFRSRAARVDLSRHIARREAQWRFVLACVYTLMHALKQQGVVVNYRVYGLNSPEAKAGCNCRFVLGGRRRRVISFGLAISRRAVTYRQSRYPSIPQLLVRNANDLAPEIFSLFNLPRRKQ